LCCSSVLLVCHTGMANSDSGGVYISYLAKLIVFCQLDLKGERPVLALPTKRDRECFHLKRKGMHAMELMCGVTFFLTFVLRI
jgi:hypothetical protein